VHPQPYNHNLRVKQPSAITAGLKLPRGHFSATGVEENRNTQAENSQSRRMKNLQARGVEETLKETAAVELEPMAR